MKSKMILELYGLESLYKDKIKETERKIENYLKNGSINAKLEYHWELYHKCGPQYGFVDKIEEEKREMLSKLLKKDKEYNKLIQEKNYYLDMLKIVEYEIKDIENYELKWHSFLFDKESNE